MKFKLLLRFALASVAVAFSAMCCQGQTLTKPQAVGPVVPGLCERDDVYLVPQTNGCYLVKIIWAGQPSGEPFKQPDDDIRNIQVWLLQPDGTSIPQNGKPGFAWMGWLGSVDDEMLFVFGRAPTG